MLQHRTLIGVALATLLAAFVASSAQADDRKSNDARKNGTASTGLLVAGAAHDFGAAFSRDRDKCDKDDDKDKDHGGVRNSSGSKHKRPDCDDDGDDDDDCDGPGHGHHHGHDHKKPKDCHPSPSR